jgi:aminoglycoside phosphotransferase (APT) family kinase protein
MPYNFGESWLYDASVEHQQRLQRATVDVLGELHAIADAVRRAPYLERSAAGDTHLRRHVRATHEWYRWAAEGGFRSPLVERAFSWLDDHWPADEGEPVLSWGDARIGNIMFGDDFRPVAVLDWELAGLGPRELDVMWLVYGHRVFEDIAASLGLGGMPHLLRPADVATAYEHATGYAPRDQAFYGTYAATQFAIVFLRTGRRQVHFGEIDAPGEPDELIMNRDALEQMLAGAYWH